MKYALKNCWTGSIIFEDEIDCADDAHKGLKRGLIARRAYGRGVSLRGANLRQADLDSALLDGMDFAGADLRSANMRGAKMTGTTLRGANMSSADLRHAVLCGADLNPVPRIPNIHQAVYRAASAPGALDMSAWHQCETTHCRAGWVITLAGEAGRVLEGAVGTPTAAALIYTASDPALERIPDFYASNKEALADMKRLAEAEAAD